VENRDSVFPYRRRKTIFINHLTWPRKSLKYTITGKTSAESAYIKRKIYKSIDKVFGIPLWINRTSLSSEAASDQKQLDVDSIAYYNSYEVGAPVIILASLLNYEVGIIDSITDTKITLEDNLVNTWPVGTSVYPLLQGNISVDQQAKMITSGVGTFIVDFEEQYDGEITRSSDGSVDEYPEYNSLPVFDIEPNWIKPIVG